MNDGHPAIGIGILLIFILVNAILYGFAAAIQAVDETLIEMKAKEGDKKSKKILNWIDNPVKLINSIHISTMIMNMLVGVFVIQMIGGSIEYWLFRIGIGPEYDSYHFSWVTFCVTIIIIILLPAFGVFIPKKTSTKNPESFVYTFYGFISILLIIVNPITYIISKISSATLRLFGISPNDNDDNVTEAEIITMVNEGHEQGVLLADEAEMITNIFEFGDKEAQDIMTHRKNIVAIDGTNTIDETFKIIIEENSSRFPVYEKEIDNIMGILHFKDLIKVYAEETMRSKTLLELKDELLYDAHFIPETRNINALFKSMQYEKIHMAIVVDEYGQTSGIVTMEDILEEIVGNIMDEHDEEELLIQYQEDGSYIMDGSAMLNDIEDLLDIEFEDDDYDTLNGFMINHLGKIPDEGEDSEINYKGYIFKILHVESKMIKRVKVKNIETEEISVSI